MDAKDSTAGHGSQQSCRADSEQGQQCRPLLTGLANRQLLLRAASWEVEHRQTALTRQRDFIHAET